MTDELYTSYIEFLKTRPMVEGRYGRYYILYTTSGSITLLNFSCDSVSHHETKTTTKGEYINVKGKRIYLSEFSTP